MENLNNYRRLYTIVYPFYYSAPYKADNIIKITIKESTNLNTPEKILLSFFKKSVAILDEVLLRVKQKYPNMVS